MQREVALYLIIGLGAAIVLAWFLRKFLARLAEPPDGPGDGVHPPKEPAVAKRIAGGFEVAVDDDELDAEEERREWRRKTGTEGRAKNH